MEELRANLAELELRVRALEQSLARADARGDHITFRFTHLENKIDAQYAEISASIERTQGMVFRLSVMMVGALVVAIVARVFQTMLGL